MSSVQDQVKVKEMCNDVNSGKKRGKTTRQQRPSDKRNVNKKNARKDIGKSKKNEM